ncbi:unnamed protein product [Rotaria sp. Silwood1]|nr:unnamed protein product [Rotaria sp. Silwood1]CAF3565062.1 unnamed protein product [Rotaria sp. Silwood1]CAF3667743.1 unnamed protein product [Rotaria sp. Silwood1]CAF4685426.1 unnamed protein product [Rotaria sp. Silwood1]CAF4966955.1 unnamed protein product [Rotaria sp. Silwood1]
MKWNNIDFTWPFFSNELISFQHIKKYVDMKLFTNDKATNLSSFTRVFHKLYQTIGAFNVWLIGLSILCLSCIALFSLIESWTIFFYLTLAPYLIILSWSLPLTRIGSWKAITSIIHRLCGILSLLLPMGLIIYNSWTNEHPPRYLYFIAVLSVTFNCIFGALLIPRRIPSFDIPTIRAFGVGVTLGLSFVGWSLVWYFGAESWFAPFGYACAIYSFITCFFAWNDSLQHIYTNRTNPYYATQLDLEYFKPPKRPYQVGLKHQPYKLWEVFTIFPFKSVHPKLQEVTVTPSSAAVVFTVTLTAIFSFTTLLQWHYLYCGPSGMILRHELFPSYTKYSAYLALLAAVANNFGTFAGTLVVQQKVSSFWGAFFNAIGLLIPVVGTLTFQLRVPHENILYSILLNKCST